MNARIVQLYPPHVWYTELYVEFSGMVGAS